MNLGWLIGLNAGGFRHDLESVCFSHNQESSLIVVEVLS